MLFYIFLTLFLTVSSIHGQDMVGDWKLTNRDISLERIRFQIALPQQNLDLLEAQILDISNPISPNYGQWLTKDYIDKLVSPSWESVSPLIRWLNDHKIQNEWESDTISCLGKVKDINSAFHTQIQEYGFKNWRLSTSPTDYQLPPFQIDFIDGLSNPLPLVSSLNQKTGENTMIDQGVVGREVIQRLYNLTLPSERNKGTGKLVKGSVGVIEFMGLEGFSASDLEQSQLGNGIVEFPNVKVVGVNHENSPDDESQLDIQVIAELSPELYPMTNPRTNTKSILNTDLVYWGANSWMYTFCTDFYAQPNLTDVISLSWGWNEADQCSIASCKDSKQYVQRVNTEFMKITGRGVTICVASGDAGAPGRTNEVCQTNPLNNPLNPVFPGSSPWVTSVSATAIVAGETPYHYKTPMCIKMGCANGTVQVPTHQSLVGWTTGGGFDNYNPTPKWQQSHVKKYLTSNIPFPSTNTWNQNGRGYPDVSMVGHNCAIYNSRSGGWSTMDGTSCSAPMFAGVVANLNQYRLSIGKPVVGFINPLIYHLSSTFTDITVGNNSGTELMSCNQSFGYQATLGWDPVSGLGTPNLGRLISELERL